MRIAIITAYCTESRAVLERCVASVRTQTLPCTHILVGDGVRHGYVDEWDCQHIVTSVRHNDVGNTPRLLGAASAAAQGFDALCWLDADNWLEPGHVAALTALARESDVAVVTASRFLRRLDGSMLGVCTQSDGVTFNDTSCYLLRREAMSLAMAWGFEYQPRGMAAIGDRFFWEVVQEHFPRRAHCTAPTVNYTTRYAAHYLERAEVPPRTACVLEDVDGILKTVPYYAHESLSAG